MPEYNWRHCDAEYNEVRQIGDTDFICPICGEKANRIYSPPAITFRGTGWGKDGK